MSEARYVPVSVGGIGGPRIGIAKVTTDDDGNTVADIRLYPGASNIADVISGDVGEVSLGG